MQQMNLMQMIQAFNQFKQNFHGNAKEEVMKMLQNGQLTQQQLNEAQQMANQFKDMLKY